MVDSAIEKIARQAQEYYKSVPVIILGSGASAAFKMSGMWQLAQHLKASVDLTGASAEQYAEWVRFVGLLDGGTDLESALHQVQLADEITKKVVVATWQLLVPEDLKIFQESFHRNDYFALGKLLRHLFKSTQSQLNIITTNYDRLAEYACEQENLHHYSGFSHGYRRHAVPKTHLQSNRQVNIWKVHGSLDWFSTLHGQIVCTGNVAEIPDGLQPMIVTPGREKYRNTHREPYKSIIHAADDVLDTAASYLCIGFGFNDEHIQEKLVNRCAKNNASVVVVTYSLSDAAKRFLFDGGLSNWLAIECNGVDKGSVIYSSELDGEYRIDQDLWSLSGFLKLVL